ncbi:MAG: Bax inhibitor-1/YccA family protein [Myxococcota bacterium]|nr:Bax inhibitor-1/YccA family protein [Myxococcota bacterium]
MRTANPALNKNTFKNFAGTRTETSMTIQGTATKTFMLLGLLVFAATWTWRRAMDGVEGAGDFSAVMPLVLGGAIGGFVVALITVFKKTWAPVTSPIYALLEGLFLGGISAIFEAMYPGIVLQAVVLTFGTLCALLFAYKSRIIKPTENFKLGIAAATGGIFLIYLVSIVAGFFGVGIPYIHDSGPIGIGFSLVVVVIAALNLVLDFDFIENGAEMGAPKYMEWYGAFGLIVTLVWLYIEILRLLAKLRSR